MNIWETLLKFIGLRAQARVTGASVQEANAAAATAVVLDEVQKKADEAAKKK